MNSPLSPNNLNEGAAAPATAEPASPADPQAASSATAPAAVAAPAGTPKAPAKTGKRKSKGKLDAPDEFAMLRMTLFSLFTIGVVAGLLFAWTGYSNRYAQVTDGWHIGQTKLIEVTVVKEDKQRLACASDVEVEGHHCGWRANGVPFDSHTQDDAHVLSPFNTVKNELFVASGLWTSLAPLGALPGDRFTAACNYKILGVVKSMSLRWQETASFDPLKQSVTVGTLTNCVIPK